MLSFGGRQLLLLCSSLLVAAAFWATDARAADIVLDLTGRADAENGGVGQVGQFGDYGLFLGRDFNDASSETGPVNNGNTRFYNWRWNSVEMRIFDNGNANISGAITRLLDEVNGDAPPNGDNRVWNLNIDLSGLVLTGNTWHGGETGIFDGIIEALQGGGEFGVGLEWTDLEMSLVPDPDYVPTGTSVPPDNWFGEAMPNIGHPNVAELHLDSGSGLTFEAWYRHQPLNESYYYRIGDTKANASPRPSTPPGVPEPGSIALLGTGVVALLVIRRRQRNGQDEPLLPTG